MKRLFAILLPVMLCLQLLACGKQLPEETLGITDKIEAVENSSALVVLSVNPSFEIYADGSRVETWLDADGRTTEIKTYDAGNRCTDHAEWNYRADGHTVFHYDGVTGAVIHEEVFTLDGKRIKSTILFDWGGKIEEYYDASGELCREVSKGMDGSITDKQYHESGRTECIYSAAGMLVAIRDKINHGRA